MGTKGNDNQVVGQISREEGVNRFQSDTVHQVNKLMLRQIVYNKPLIIIINPSCVVSLDVVCPYQNKG